uniref:Triadin n=2 Tax=Dicentrarchus labrax TaxID=13489 RepID=A0A8P4FV84_DICLA
MLSHSISRLFMYFCYSRPTMHFASCCFFLKVIFLSHPKAEAPPLVFHTLCLSSLPPPQFSFSQSCPPISNFFLCSQLSSPMSSQPNGGEAVAPAQTNRRTFLDDVILTFSSPMAWLLIVALILTWSGVAIVLFDLLDYKTLAGLPPPSAIAKRGLRARGIRPIRSSPAAAPADVAAPESTDWLEMVWNFAASLVAPDDEEEGIHQLTETLTSFHSEEL